VANVYNPQMSAYDGKTGTLLWTALAPYTRYPITAANGVVYDVSGPGSCSFTSEVVTAVRETDGAMLWQQCIQEVNGAASGVAVTDVGVCLAFTIDKAYSLNPASGITTWRFDGSTGSTTGALTSVVYAGRLYVRDPSGGVVLDLRSGRQVGTFAAGPAPPAFSGSTGFFLSAGTLAARDVSTNALLWSFTGDGSLDSAPIVVNGYVYVGSSAGNLYALHVDSGAQAWTVNTGSGISDPREGFLTTGLTAAEGVLLVPSGSYLVAYSN